MLIRNGVRVKGAELEIGDRGVTKVPELPPTGVEGIRDDGTELEINYVGFAKVPDSTTYFRDDGLVRLPESDLESRGSYSALCSNTCALLNYRAS